MVLTRPSRGNAGKAVASPLDAPKFKDVAETHSSISQVKRDEPYVLKVDHVYIHEDDSGNKVPRMAEVGVTNGQYHYEGKVQELEYVSRESKKTVKIVGMYLEVVNDVDLDNPTDRVDTAYMMCLRVAQFAEFLPENSTIVLNVPDNTTGLSFAHALEAAIRGFPRKYAYGGDSDPTNEFLPSATMSTEDILIKMRLDHEVILKTPVSFIADGFDSIKTYLSKPMSGLPLKCLLETSDPILEAMLQQALSGQIPQAPQPREAVAQHDTDKFEKLHAGMQAELQAV